MLTSLMGLLAVAGLSLDLTASEPTVLVGEPVALTIAFTATDRDQKAKTTAVVVLIDDGAGYRPHYEARLSSDLLIDIGVDLQPGVRFRTGLVIAVAGARRVAGDSFRFALPSPGTYRLRAKYGVVLSNEVVLSVVPPQGREAELYETYLKENPYLLTRWATETDEDVARLQDLLHRYEGSRYLYLPQIRSWMFEIRQAELAFGRSGGGTSGESPLEHDVGAVLDKIQAVDWRSRPAFDESRLALIAETRLKWGDREGAFEVYRQLIERHPDAPLAQAGRRLIGADDKIPPELAVSPNIAVLWPPNRAMIPIDVSVSAADDFGAVSVKLASITCNDACNPALDVSEPTTERTIARSTCGPSVGVRARKAGPTRSRTLPRTLPGTRQPQAPRSRFRTTRARRSSADSAAPRAPVVPARRKSRRAVAPGASLLPRQAATPAGLFPVRRPLS